MTTKRSTNQDAPTRGVHARGSSAEAPKHTKDAGSASGLRTPRFSRQRTHRRSDISSDISKYYDLGRYRDTNKKRNRKFILKVVAVSLISVIMLTGVAVALYVTDINSRLTRNVTDQLRQTLDHSEPGDPFYMLLLGIDKDQGRVEDTENYGADSHNYRSDSIMLCRIDPKNVKVTMVSIHRDTLIDMGEHGQQKINAAYSFGGAAYATQVVSEFAGVPISHYAEVDLDRFIAIVDTVGGVTVTLPVPVYDPEYTGLDLPAGEQTLNGLEAALLCRCRHGYDKYGDGDRYRAANQRMVFSEIIKKVMHSDPATIVASITQMADSVTTDLTLAQILDLAGQMQTIDVEKDIMTGMEPTEGVYIEGAGWYEQCIKSEWNTMMNRVNQGLPPYDETQFDETAGVAGAVGEAGAREANAAKNAGATKPNESSTASREEDPDVVSEPEPEPVPEPEPEYYYEPEPYYEYYEPEIW